MVCPFAIVLIIKEYNENGTGIGFVYGIILAVLAFTSSILSFALYSSKPFRQLTDLKETNPQLLQVIENDFRNSRALCLNVWRGNYYYFFKGWSRFLAVPVGRVKAIEVVRVHHRRCGMCVDFHITSDEGTVKVIASTWGANDKGAINVAQGIACESGIVCDLSGVS